MDYTQPHCVGFFSGGLGSCFFSRGLLHVEVRCAVLSYRCDSWRCKFGNASAAHMCCEYSLGMFAGFSMAFSDFRVHCRSWKEAS